MITLQCPHCSAALGVNEISEQKVLTRCPNCHRLVLLVDEGDGYFSLNKLREYKCKKCGNEFAYDGRPEAIRCEKCGETYVTSEYGDYMIETSTFIKGEADGFEYNKKEDKLIQARNAWRKTSKWVRAAAYTLIVGIIVLLVGLYIDSLPPDILASKAYADSYRFWTEFRQKNPLNLQIAAINKYDDGSYNVLVSEPSEDVSEEDLNKVFKKYNSKLRTYQAVTGYDGWLKDAVISFNDIEESKIPDMTKDLFKLLYGTDYKAEMLNFSEIPTFTAYSRNDLNIQVTEEELRSWLLEGEETFATSNSSDYAPLDELMNADAPDVYYSKNPGFVVWILLDGQNDSIDFKIKSRIFALDSDLVLGAIKKNRRVAIIGRERQESLWDLPPMRSETLSILASTGEDELQQSYERTRLLAGKMNGKDGGKDWAPILLSNALWHTEYGNLLNTTDQMLKSWSENGDIEYERFDYPKPVYWAFKDGALKDIGTNQLTYNWNTEGVGYVVDDGKYEIYALNRTGSLPVSYIPGESKGISARDPVYQAEEMAYDFFSSLSNTSLVRVVQYAAMYQIFKNMDISLTNEVDVEGMSPVVTQEMYNSTSAFVNNIRYYNKEKYTKIFLKHFGEKYGVNLNHEKYSSFSNSYKTLCNYKDDYLTPDNVNNFISSINYFRNTPDSILRYYNDIYMTLEIVDSLNGALSPVDNDETFIKSLSNYLADGNIDSVVYTEDLFSQVRDSIPISVGGKIRYLPILSKGDKVEFAISEFSRFIMNPYLKEFFRYSNPKSRTSYFRDQYCNANKGRSRQWMKCPTVVQSWQESDSTYAEGGHNLNSKVTSFRVNKALKKGEVREVEINGKILYEVSPSDLRAGVTSQSYLRRVGRLGDTSLDGVGTVVRARKSVIPTTARAVRGASKEHLKINATAKGYEIDGKTLSWSDLLDEVSVRITNGKGDLPFVEIETTNFNKAGVEVQAMIDGISYKMPRGAGYQMPLSKFDMANYTTEIQGDRAIIKIPIKSGKIDFTTSKVSDKSLNNGVKVQQNLTIKEGAVVFNVPKSRLNEFMTVIKEYLRNINERWNQFHLQRRMRMRGLDPMDIKESTYLRIAKNNKKYKLDNYVWYIQEEKTA
ncbi:MAG: hypothetical protein ACI4US_06240 [Muribaculaceae bacterium]